MNIEQELGDIIGARDSDEEKAFRELIAADLRSLAKFKRKQCVFKDEDSAILCKALAGKYATEIIELWTEMPTAGHTWIVKFDWSK
jgi:hypothetical protein